MSNYILGLLLAIVFFLTNKPEYFIASVILIAAGDIRRQIKEAHATKP